MNFHLDSQACSPKPLIKGFPKKKKKKDTCEFTYKTEIDSQTYKTNLWLPKGKQWGINWELGLTHTHYYIQNR